MGILRALILASAATLVVACATTKPMALETAETSAASYCSEVPFTSVTSCVRARFDRAYPRWRSDANADLVNIFLAWGDAAAVHVQDGILSEADAKQKASALESRLDQIAYDRRVRREIRSQLAAQMMLTGAALIAAAGQPAPAPLIVTPMQQPTVMPTTQRAPVPVSSVPTLRTPAPSPLIVCSVTGDAQFAVAACH
jgi:hypothetical protein